LLGASRAIDLKATLFRKPLHPYTEALLAAVPVPDPAARRAKRVLQGDVADPSDPPAGCPFHPRCRYAEARCRQEVPELREVAPEQWVRCIRADEIRLAGVGAADRRT